MRKIIFEIIVLSLISFSVQAQDWMLREVKINSCAVLSYKNAHSISTEIFVLPTIVASQYPGVIINGHTLRKRYIPEISELDISDELGDLYYWPLRRPEPWEYVNERELLLYQNKNMSSCVKFIPGSVVMVAEYWQSLDCDTGPEIDGYCALTVPEVVDVPGWLEPYVR